ncbi:MAG: pyruvate dehydrogenase complex E1 component subunit beta [Flavobacteriales bacterium]
MSGRRKEEGTRVEGRRPEEAEAPRPRTLTAYCGLRTADCRLPTADYGLSPYLCHPSAKSMRTIQFREALNEAMSEEMRRDPNVFLMGEEVAEYDGAYKVSKGMLAEFGPERIIDTPISELGFTGIGVGAAMNGLRPIVEFMTWNFAILAADQIINHAAKMLQMSGGQFHIPIVFRGGNGHAGQLAATHSQSFEAMYANVPGLKVVTPSNPYDAKGLLKAAIRDEDPVLVMESERMYGDKGEVPDGEYLVPIGVADIKREGTDVTIVGFGKMMKEALAAAEELAKEGVEAEVIDLRTIRPMDHGAILKSVRKTNRCVVVDENWPVASIASEVAYRVQKDAFDFLDAPVLRINQADTPLPFSPPLIEASIPNPARIIAAVKEVMYLRK